MRLIFLYGRPTASISRRIPTASCKIFSSSASSLPIWSANGRIRRLRASISSRFPFIVAARNTVRRSSASRVFLTNPCTSNAFTIRVIVGGRTCSASANSPSVIGPANTITDNADSRAEFNPLDPSTLRTLRSKPIAAACSASAVASELARLFIDNLLGLY